VVLKTEILTFGEKSLLYVYPAPQETMDTIMKERSVKPERRHVRESVALESFAGGRYLSFTAGDHCQPFLQF